MNKIVLLAVLALFLVSCGGSRKVTNSNRSKSKIERTSKSSGKAKVNNIVSYAKTFEGTRYKFGGTTKSGMDCSGLVYTAFKKENILMPRISRDMAREGIRITRSKAAKGDLVFFKTSKSRNVINHVGLIVDIRGGDILFIHSTTSGGVIISSLDERYWRDAFVEIRRII